MLAATSLATSTTAALLMLAQSAAPVADKPVTVGSAGASVTVLRATKIDFSDPTLPGAQIQRDAAGTLWIEFS